MKLLPGIGEVKDYGLSAGRAWRIGVHLVPAGQGVWGSRLFKLN